MSAAMEHADQESTLGPRILGKWMPHFIGKNVRLIGCKMSETSMLTVDVQTVELTVPLSPECPSIADGK